MAVPPGTLCDACHAAQAWAEIILPSGRNLTMCGHHTRRHFGNKADPGLNFTIIYPTQTV